VLPGYHSATGCATISFQVWKSETTQEDDNSRQVQPLGSTRKAETLQAKC